MYISMTLSDNHMLGIITHRSAPDKLDFQSTSKPTDNYIIYFLIVYSLNESIWHSNQIKIYISCYTSLSQTIRCRLNQKYSQNNLIRVELIYTYFPVKQISKITN